MKIRLKPLHEQVVVIVGASSGIGLATARMAAARGARVLLAARNESDLQQAAEDIRRHGGRAAYAVADVSQSPAVEAIADTAIREFGRIDTWVNAAAVALYGTIMELAEDDMRRQVDVIFWGTVHGSRTASRRMRDEGGALINVASVAADRAIPLQGIYSAAKHGVKGFTDALRMELEAEGLPIAVTLVKPASIDTPLFDKAKSLLGVEPQPVPPVYPPESVAEAILECAQRPVRSVIVGGAGTMLTGLNAVAPRLVDRYMERRLFRQQRTDRPTGPNRQDNLYAPVGYDGDERGEAWRGRVKHGSAYTWARLHPGRALLVAVAAGVAVAGLAARLRPHPGDDVTAE